MLQPDIILIASPMGGGWAVPLTDEGEDAGVFVFDEAPASVPLVFGGGAGGWIMEPQEADDLLHALLLECVTVELPTGRVVTLNDVQGRA